MTHRPRHVVATWLYEQEADEGGAYAQMTGDSSSEPFRDVYRRCVAIFFLTARLANPTAELVLVLNRPWRIEASAVAEQVHALLESVGVEVHVRQYSFAPPSEWPSEWRNQFFVLDALDLLTAGASPDDLLVLLDCDVVWTGSDRTAALWTELSDARSLTMHIDYPPDLPVNGMTRQELTELAVELGLITASNEVLPYSGGELVALSAAGALDVCAAAREVWPGVIARFEDSRLRGMDEAHLLSMLYANLGLTTGNASAFVKRLWTQPFRYRNTQPGDEELVVWHVPAEKRYGLRRIYDALVSEALDPHDRSWARPSVIGRYVGVPRNSAEKVVRDTTRALLSRLRSAFG